MEGRASIAVDINARRYDAEVYPRLLLSDFLRHEANLTGTHVGCGNGTCGACTVLLDGRPVRSCLLLAVQADERSITTVEGLGTPDRLHPMQQAFHEHHALQCGFCTPGFLMSGAALLERTQDPTDDEILAVLGGHLCRCTGYQNILRAMKTAVEITNSSDGR